MKPNRRLRYIRRRIPKERWIERACCGAESGRAGVPAILAEGEGDLPVKVEDVDEIGQESPT